MVDFSKLKASRKSSIEELTKKVESLQKGGTFQKDERIWKPPFDKKDGKGSATIRFIPSKSSDPFVQLYYHSFSGPGGYYIENSLSTIDKDDPVGIANKAYWDKGEAEANESLKNVARNHKRNQKFYANIYVIKDSENPENEGTVKIFEFGAQIFKIIQSKIKPQFEDDSPIDPFNLWDGCDFRIRAIGKEIPDKKTGNKIVVPNYDTSSFDSQSELFSGNDEKKEEIYNQTHDLNEFMKFKTFEELAEKYEKVTGEKYDALSSGTHKTAADRLAERVTMEENQEPNPMLSSTPAKTDEVNTDEDEDDALAMFQRLANMS